MSNRRDFFTRLSALGAAWFASKQAASAQHEHHHPEPAKAPAATSVKVTQSKQGRGLAAKMAPSRASAASAPVPVETPDIPKLPFKMVDGVKEFHLIAEPVRVELLPGRVMDAWGYNGSIPGPTIEANQGDRVRVIFDNKLPEMTAIHWHGFEVPMEMDGSVGLGQDPVPPGGRFVYEFTLNQEGTFFYHSHFAMQEMMGMLGMFILHPKEAHEPKVDRDFGLILQEWALLPNNTVPNTLSMEFNWLTLNGKAGPACTPMIVKQGERVRIRLVNIGMDHHPIHLHGNTFYVTGTEAGRCPEVTWTPQNTVLVGVAQARDIEFDAKFIGDWMIHCHLPHHMMNQMVSMVGPITHGMHSHGMQTGGGMEEGMGMLKQGGALSDEAGPTMGRGLGLAADAERSTSNLVAQVSTAATAILHSCPMHPEVKQTGPGKCPKCGMALVDPTKAQAVQGHEGHTGHSSTDPAMDMYPKDDPEKKKVPGYPQDMWMPMDEPFNNKPENYGLRKGWSGAMMGMMSLVRVVTPETYDKIMALKAAQPAEPNKTPQPHVHQHEQGAGQ
jgi:manganese oxidase